MVTSAKIKHKSLELYREQVLVELGDLKYPPFLPYLPTIQAFLNATIN